MSEQKKFKPKQLWNKTMPFVWAKLMIRLVAIAIGAVILGAGLWIFTINDAVGVIAIFIGFGMSIAVYGFIIRVFGYAIRVGHIAVLVEAIKTGQMPKNQIAYGKEKVVANFATAGAFFVLNRLVDNAVKQLQRGLGSIASIFGSLPGMGSVVKFGQKVLKIALKFVDDCCIGWIFYNEGNGETATKRAVDGVVIYAQNWKAILGNALKTAIMVVILTSVIGFLMLIVAAILVSVINFTESVWGILAFFLGLMLTFAIKRAFIDSWVMIRVLHTYMEVAPTTEIRFDVYGRLSGMSRSFRKMCDQARSEIPTSGPVTAAAPVGAGGRAFCGECGAKNTSGAGFCGDCGQKM